MGSNKIEEEKGDSSKSQRKKKNNKLSKYQKKQQKKNKKATEVSSLDNVSNEKEIKRKEFIVQKGFYKKADEFTEKLNDENEISKNLTKKKISPPLTEEYLFYLKDKVTEMKEKNEIKRKEEEEKIKKEREEEEKKKKQKEEEERMEKEEEEKREKENEIKEQMKIIQAEKQEKRSLLRKLKKDQKKAQETVKKKKAQEQMEREKEEKRKKKIEKEKENEIKINKEKEDEIEKIKKEEKDILKIYFCDIKNLNENDLKEKKRLASKLRENSPRLLKLAFKLCRKILFLKNLNKNLYKTLNEKRDSLTLEEIVDIYYQIYIITCKKLKFREKQKYISLF